MDGGTAMALAFVLGFSVCFFCVGVMRSYQIDKSAHPNFEPCKLYLTTACCCWCCLVTILWTTWILKSQQDKEDDWERGNSTDSNPYTKDRERTELLGLLGDVAGVLIGVCVFCVCCRGPQAEQYFAKIGFPSATNQQNDNQIVVEQVEQVRVEYPAGESAAASASLAPPAYSVADDGSMPDVVQPPSYAAAVEPEEQICGATGETTKNESWSIPSTSAPAPPSTTVVDSPASVDNLMELKLDASLAPELETSQFSHEMAIEHESGALAPQSATGVHSPNSTDNLIEEEIHSSQVLEAEILSSSDIWIAKNDSASLPSAKPPPPPPLASAPPLPLSTDIESPTSIDVFLMSSENEAQEATSSTV